MSSMDENFATQTLGLTRISLLGATFPEISGDCKIWGAVGSVRSLLGLPHLLQISAREQKAIFLMKLSKNFQLETIKNSTKKSLLQNNHNNHI